MMRVQAFHEYRANQITFDQLCREIMPDVRRLADYVYRRWAKKLPDSVEACDLEQVMLMRLPRALEKWNPQSSYPVDKYVQFAMLSKAKKFVHLQRKAVDKNTKAPSRHVLSFSRIERRSERDPALFFLDRTPVDAPQEKNLAIRQELDRIGPLRVVVEEYFSTGSVDQAGDRLASNNPAREQVGVRTLAEARLAARGIITSFATAVLV